MFRELTSWVHFHCQKKKEYILSTVGYFSKWAEAMATSCNDSSVVIEFVRKNIFSQFRAPRALISDGGRQFCNERLDVVLQKYGINHRVSLA